MNLTAAQLGAKSVTSLIRQNAERSPELPVYTFIDSAGVPTIMTLAELDTIASSVAHLLGAHLSNLEKRPALLLYPTNSRQFIEAFWGALYAGVPAIPLSLPKRKREWDRVHRVLRDAGTEFIMTTREYADSLVGIARPDFSGKLDVLVTDDLPKGFFYPTSDPSGSTISHLQYSSGSTGKPKGIAVTHQNILHNVRYIDHEFQHDPSSVMVSWLPHFHDMGLIYGILAAPLLGFRAVLMTPMDFISNPLSWLQVIARYRATHSGAPNFAYALCAKNADNRGDVDLSLESWRTAFVGAEMVHPSTLEDFSKTFRPNGFQASAFYPAYGLAEATLKVTGRRYTPDCIRSFSRSALASGLASPVSGRDETAVRLVSNGMPSDDMDILIVSGNGEPAQPDEVGEIWVSGPSVTLGYWRNQQETKSTFAAHCHGIDTPFMRTGDLGFLHGGELFVVGRSKDMIILRGQNYYPDDVESVIGTSNPAFQSRPCAACDMEGQDTEDLLIVQEIHRHTSPAEYPLLLEAIRASTLSALGISASIIALVRQGAIPRTTSGKVQRNACRIAFLDGSLDVLARLDLRSDAVSGSLDQLLESPCRYSQSEILKLLLEFAAVLIGTRFEELDPTTTPFALGLDSLQLTRFAAKIGALPGTPTLPVRWEQGSFEEIATLVAEGLDVERKVASPAVSVDPQIGWQVPTPDEKRLWTMEMLYPGSPAHRIVFAIRIVGNLDLARLESTLIEVEANHLRLRTGFHNLEDGLHKVLRSAENSNYIDLVRTCAGGFLQELAHELCRRPISLEAGELTSYLVRSESADKHDLLVCVHHIAFDAISAAIFHHEVARTYQNTGGGTWHSLYDGLGASEGASTTGPLKRIDDEFWHSYLHRASERAAFPWGVEDRLTVGMPARLRHLRFPDLVQNHIQELARAAKVSPYVILLTAFITAWSKWTSATELTLSIPVSGRSDVSAWEQIGLFAHPTILSLNWGHLSGFRDKTIYIQSTLDQLQAHQDTAFSDIVCLLQPTRRVHRLPFMDVFFNYLRSPREDVIRFEDSIWELEPLDSGITDCFLNCFIYMRSNGSLQGWIKSPEGWHESAIEIFAELLEHSLATMVNRNWKDLETGNEQLS